MSSDGHESHDGLEVTSVLFFELRAYHHDRDVDEVTTKLGIIPQNTVKAGDPSVIPELGPIPDNGWFLVGDYNPDDPAGEDDFWQLLGKLSQKEADLRFLRTVGWELDILFDLLPDDSKPNLSPLVTRACSALGLPIGFSPAYGLIGNL